MTKLWHDMKDRVFCGRDPDSIITYSTVKKVVLKDCFLGCLSYFFMLCALGYFVGYVMLYQKQYLTRQKPSGTTRITIMEPNYTELNTSVIEYCDGYNTTNTSGHVFPCVYKPADMVVVPPSLGREMFVSTTLKRTVYNATCGDYGDRGCSVTSGANILDHSQVYNGGIEWSTVLIDHTIHAASIEKSLMFMNGEMVDCNGKTVKRFNFGKRADNETRDQYLQRVSFPLQWYLEAACIPSLNIASGAEANSNNTLREDGMVLVVTIEYDNTKTFNTDDVEYTVSTRRLEGQKYKVVRFLDDANASAPTVTYENRHGVLIEVVQTGQVGTFIYSELFVQLAGAMALLSIGTVLTDLLARFVLRDRAIYRAAMTDTTNDIDEIRAGRLPLFETPDTGVDLIFAHDAIGGTGAGRPSIGEPLKTRVGVTPRTEGGETALLSDGHTPGYDSV
eukprot:TRINITY_DN69397_c0_g1_i1.p1 TRINITY_DN69397_c0_g1~~TRINITY_DN69397_c0_g1_i1.p1  ORF type:complete len:448 (-),score=64.97 TRINITY_DN69397_c0_g1_i1:546-1889(-)